MPYLGGEDLNTRPDQSPRRFVINFFDWPSRRDLLRDEGRRFGFRRMLSIVKERVQARTTDKVKTGEPCKYWWRFGRHAPSFIEQ